MTGCASAGWRWQGELIAHQRGERQLLLPEARRTYEPAFFVCLFVFCLRAKFKDSPSEAL
jgi:hypothetical protein